MLALQVGLEALEDRDGLARAHLHDGLLPGPRAAGGVAAALGLRGHGRGAHLEHGHVEQALDGLLDLRLVGVGVHAERVLAGGGQHVGLLGHDRADQNLAVIHYDRSSRRARAVRLSSAPCEATTVAAPTMSATPTSSACSTWTPARLRNDLAAIVSSSASAIRTEPPRWAVSSSAARLVDGSSKPAASSTCSDPRSACTDSAARSAARRALRLTLTV